MLTLQNQGNEMLNTACICGYRYFLPDAATLCAGGACTMIGISIVQTCMLVNCNKIPWHTSSLMICSTRACFSWRGMLCGSRSCALVIKVSRTCRAQQTEWAKNHL